MTITIVGGKTPDPVELCKRMYLRGKIDSEQLEKASYFAVRNDWEGMLEVFEPGCLEYEPNFVALVDGLRAEILG
jgi:hypothetical protein